MIKEVKDEICSLYDRIVVKRVEEKEVKKGSIIIPDTAKEKPQKAQVIAVGPGKTTEEGSILTVKIGDLSHRKICRKRTRLMTTSTFSSGKTKFFQNRRVIEVNHG